MRGWLDLRRQCPRCRAYIKPYRRQCSECGTLVVPVRQGGLMRRAVRPCRARMHLKFKREMEKAELFGKYNG